MENERDGQLAIIAETRAAVADRLITPWLVWCLALLTFVITVVAGRRFDEALREQLRAGA